MCISPVTIPNVNYGQKSPLIRRMYDCESRFLNVPCGHCCDCVAVKQQYLVQRARLVARDHDIYFATLTYSPKYLPTIKAGDFVHPFPDIRDVQLLFKRLRNVDAFYGRSWKYIVSSEYGGMRHRPHFHILFFVKRDADQQALFERDLIEYRKHQSAFEATLNYYVFKYWSVNVGSKRNPDYRQLFDYRRNSRGECTYDLHYVDPSTSVAGVSDVAFYVTKYVFKFDKWLERKRQALALNYDRDTYKFLWNFVKTRILVSKHFGDSEDYSDYVNSCIEKAVGRYPYAIFVNPSDGRTFPLAPYLRHKFLTVDQACRIYDNCKEKFSEFSKVLVFEDPPGDPLQKVARYHRRCNAITHHNSDRFYEYE